MPAPATYVVQHTYLGEGPTRMMHHRRPAILMMTNNSEDNPREADCSGRALATLVIAWVGAALVASVLLKWTQMWVALAVLTLLFLVACGYAACDARRTQERAFARETNRQLERRRRRDEQVESVSGGVDNFPEIIDPPEYQTYWVADLPPSYTTAVGTQTGNVSPTTTPNAEDDPPQIPTPRLSNPPPYALAIQTEPLFIPIIQNGIQNVDNTSQLQGVPVAGQNIILQTSIENGQTSSHNGIRIPPVIPATAIVDQDKVERGDTNVTCTAPTPTRTQYLTSILNSTFGRNMRRANNQEQNFNAVGLQTNRDETVVNNSNNNDRNNNSNNNNNNNNNNGTGPPPPYPVTRLPTD